jgi:DNA-binding GntR family transcriptional regulator
MVKKLHRSNLSVDAYAFIKELFVNGDRYDPGDKISVEELSRELGVSRTPLWGAINRLEAEGIVEIVPRQGVYLINYDPERAIEIYIAREALEGMVARLAAERINPRQLASLRDSLDQQRECVKMGDTERYRAAAMDFHRQIVKIAKNQTLEKLLDSVYARMQAMRLQTKYFPTRLPETCDDHEQLLKAFETRDADKAEHEARQHIQALSAEIRRVLYTAENEARVAAP